MAPMFALAMKDIRLLLRDRVGFFFAFFFPLVIAIFFGVIFAGGGGSGGGTKLEIVVVDEDQTPGSKAFVEQLSTGPEFAVTPLATREQGMDVVRDGKMAAVIVVPRGFGAAREVPIWARFAGGADDDASLKVLVGVDPSRRAEAAMLTGVLTKYGFMQMQEAFRSPKKMREQMTQTRDLLASSRGGNPLIDAASARFFDSIDQFMAVLPEPDAAPAAGGAATAPMFEPMKIESLDIRRERSGPRNTFAVTFPQGVIWAVLGCALGFSISMVEERTGGTLTRLYLAPLRPWQVIGSKGLSCFIVTMTVCTALLLIAALPPFNVRPTNPIGLIVAIICVAACFVGIMMLLAVSSGTQRGGSGLGWGVLLVMSMIGGGMIPLFIMPNWMLKISVISPVRWSILAIEGGIWREFTFLKMAVPCGVLLGIGAACFAIGATVMSRRATA